MPLADVLTAVRRLILDPEPIPADPEARRASYSSRFPALRPEEIEDLVKMEPKRIRTYTDSIFSGQTNTLEDKFEITFKLLTARFFKLKNEKFYPFDFIRDLHARRPWLGMTTAALGLNLVQYLRNDRPDISAIAPEAADLAQMELLSLQTARAEDEPVAARDSLSRTDLESMKVSDLMELDLIIPALVQTAVFEYDLVAFRRKYHAGKQNLPEEPAAKRTIYTACGRDAEFYVRWRELDQPIFDWLAAADRSVPHSIEQLASILAEAAPEETAETELFRTFFDLTADLAAAGIIVLRAVQ